MRHGPFRAHAARPANIGALIVTLVAALLALAPPAARAQADAHVRMTLHAMDSDVVLYRGDRTERSEGGRITVATAYSTADGRAIQHSESVYEAESLAPVAYRQLDERSGEEESLVREGDTVRMTFRETRKEEADHGDVKWKPGVHMVATVGTLIAREWARLMAGETVEFGLLVPSRQDVYSFRLQRDAERRPSAPGRTVVRMEPGTWLVRRLVDPIYMELEDAAPHRLMQWRGRVSMKTDDGKPQDLIIDYGYGS